MKPAHPEIRQTRTAASHSVFGIRCSALFFLLLLVGSCGAFATNSPETQPSKASATNEVSNSTNAAPAKPREISLSENKILKLLTSTLQDEYVKDKGELELRLTDKWKPVTVPNVPLTLDVLDMPLNGVTSMFIIRFELFAARKSLGTFQVPLQARIWKEIWVARSMLKCRELVADADIARERRDVLSIHQVLADFPPGDTSLIMAEPLMAGSPLLARSVRLRPVIHRGQVTDAVVEDGVLSVTMKVEALEDGVPGQIIRARNSQTRRDIRGKVINEKTILVSL